MQCCVEYLWFWSQFKPTEHSANISYMKSIAHKWNKPQTVWVQKSLHSTFNYMICLYFFHWFKRIEKWIFSQYTLIWLIWKKSSTSLYIFQSIFSLHSVIILVGPEYKNLLFFSTWKIHLRFSFSIMNIPNQIHVISHVMKQTLKYLSKYLFLNFITSYILLNRNTIFL